MGERLFRKQILNVSAVQVTNQAMQDSVPSCMNIINDIIENGTTQRHDKSLLQYKWSVVETYIKVHFDIRWNKSRCLIYSHPILYDDIWSDKALTC